MIRRLQVKNYRCLRYLDLRLKPFQILVGRNGSGKSAILDAIGFLGDLVSSGVEAAVEKRTADFRDLVWGRPSDDLGFELAVECDVTVFDPEARQRPADDRVFRYEVAIREEGGGLQIVSERGLLGSVGGPDFGRRRARFPEPPPAPPTIFVDAEAGGYRSVLGRTVAGGMRFEPESEERVAEPLESPYVLGSGRTALAHLPDAPEDFPAALRVRRLLTEMRRLFFDCSALRRPSPPTRDTRTLCADGSNLPWVARRLQAEDEYRFGRWLGHVRSALPEIAEVRVVVREEDRHAYLMVRDRSGHEVPSWSVSDGSLRLLAHTLRLYVLLRDTLYLIEEPEDGVHPEIMQEVLDALSPVGGCQALVATQSVSILADAEAKEVLLLAKDGKGAPDVIPVLSHPRMEHWIGSPNLSDCVAGGMLSSELVRVPVSPPPVREAVS